MTENRWDPTSSDSRACADAEDHEETSAIEPQANVVGGSDQGIGRSEKYYRVGKEFENWMALDGMILYFLEDAGGQATLSEIVTAVNHQGGRASRYQIKEACDDLVEQDRLRLVQADVGEPREHFRNQTFEYATIE